MKNKCQEVSDSDDSEIIDDPSPMPVVESTSAHNFSAEKNLSNSKERSNCSVNEAVSDESSNDDLNSSKNFMDKIIKKKHKSSKKVNVTAKNKNLENDVKHMKATFEAEDLSSDDEVYIFHCPDNFMKHDLLNKNIYVSKSKQFVCDRNGEKFELKILTSENKQVTLAVPKKSFTGKLFNFPLKGHMIIQKVVETDGDPMNDLSEIEDTVVFPSDIKIRHPFLGVDWKSYIDSAKDAIDKNHFVKKMKKKIKKERTQEVADVENKKLKRKSSCEITSPKKHKKKHGSFNISFNY